MNTAIKAPFFCICDLVEFYVIAPVLLGAWIEVLRLRSNGGCCFCFTFWKHELKRESECEIYLWFARMFKLRGQRPCAVSNVTLIPYAQKCKRISDIKMDDKES
jgi:hypothetical protein